MKVLSMTQRKKVAAMRSPKATIISLEHLVDNPSEERATGE
jgi:hypothetical protein